MASNITLTGRFGNDPETFAGEKSDRTSFRFASTEYEQGQEHTDWYSVTCFGRLGERIAKQGAKGKKATLWGKLRLRKYQTRSGEERIDARVTATHVEWTEPLGAASKPKPETKYDESSYLSPEKSVYGGATNSSDDGVPF
jgi:single-strand DNA-binding protein